MNIKTLSGKTPNEYFSNLSEKSIVFMIGIPGSGKSYWSNAAKAFNFITLSGDELRLEFLIKCKNENQECVLNGLNEIPEPTDPKHLFSPEMIKLGAKLVRNQAKLLLQNNKKIIIDQTNVSLKRTLIMNNARKHNYKVHGLEFVTDDINKNDQNIKLRVSKGGHDLINSQIEDIDKKRIELLSFLKQCQDTFQAKVINKKIEYIELPESIDNSVVQSKSESIEEHFSSLSNNLELQGLSKLITSLDYFDSLDKINVNCWAKSPL